jgi:hypothetical protein
VIRAFVQLKFEGLAPATRVNYRLRLSGSPSARDVLGAVPVEEMRPALVQGFLDGYADRPAMQKVAQTALKSLEKWALVRDLLPYPITLGTEAPGSDGGNEPWTDEHVALAERHARRTWRGSSRSPPTPGSAAPIWSRCAGPTSRNTKAGPAST